VIRIDVRIQRISPIGTDFFIFLLETNIEVPKKIRTNR
jgi:hypothetical protein